MFLKTATPLNLWDYTYIFIPFMEALYKAIFYSEPCIDTGHSQQEDNTQ